MSTKDMYEQPRPDHNYDTPVYPLNIHREIGRFAFKAGRQLDASLRNVLTDEANERMGQAALVLTSEHGMAVSRVSGTLRGQDARAESAVNKLIKTIGDRQHELSRALRIDRTVKPPELVFVRLGVYLDHDAVAQAIRTGMPSDFVVSSTMPVRWAFKHDDLKRGKDLRDSVKELDLLVHEGERVPGKLVGLTYRSSHDTAVQDMAFNFKERS